MSAADRSVTVVIPTTAIPERFALLMRAIQSVKEQRNVRAIPLVVLNGAQYTSHDEDALRAEPDVIVAKQNERSLPAALRLGRSLVSTPWFASLDDDDLLTPDALDKRLGVFAEFPETEVVATSGFIRHNGRDRLNMPPSRRIGDDPLRALVTLNWFLPGCWLARTDRVLPDVFDGMPKYRECTFLALKLASQYKLRWLDEPTVIRFVDSPFAESQTREYVMGQVDAMRALAKLPLPRYLQRSIQWRIAAAHHETADRFWTEGNMQEAWREHLESLRAFRGLRYLPFTRRLLMSSLRFRMTATSGEPA